MSPGGMTLPASLRVLAEVDFQRAAVALGCDVPAIKAVAEVEAPRGGFLPDGRLVVLFEGHIFHQKTGGRYDKDYPRLSYPKWTKAYYLGGAREWDDRLTVAMGLNARAALLSTSFGKFQVMGFNHAACGYGSVEQFVAALSTGEGVQLDAFVRFVQHTKLDKPLREARWKDFARGYNGPAYAENEYDQRLAKAHAKWSAR